MTERFAKWLRRFAQYLDPQPITIELLQVSAPVRELNNLRGVPVYFWQPDERTVLLYPAPDAPLKLCVRR